MQPTETSRRTQSKASGVVFCLTYFKTPSSRKQHLEESDPVKILSSTLVSPGSPQAWHIVGSTMDSGFPFFILYFLERFIAKKVYTARWRTNNRLVPATNLNKYLYSGKSERKVNVNKAAKTKKK
jgi:hypothetical protein